MKVTKASAKRRADAAMSKYIRTKYMKYGVIKCVTCAAIKPFDEMDCAHFISRKREATRFVEENCHPACWKCNRFSPETHLRMYTLFMIDTYGREKIDELERQSKEICRRRVADYLDIERHYKELLEAL